MEMLIESHYEILARLIIDLIPEEWDEVRFYVEDDDGGQTFFLHYQPFNKREWVDYTTIPDIFNISRQDFKQKRRELTFGIKDFKKAYQNEFKNVWVNFQLRLLKDGKFNIDFNYDKNPMGPIKTHVIWQYEQLGIEKKEGLHKDLFDEYLTEKAQGKRYPFLEPMKEE